MTYASLSDSEKTLLRTISDTTVEAINQYAEMMERGEIEMRSGPVALREFAATINLTLILQERP